MNIEKEFFDYFEIPPIKKFRQYNFGQIPYGKQELKIAKEKGIVCNEHISMENGEEACIYWYELHCPTITDSRLLDMLFLANKYGFTFDFTDREKLKFVLFRMDDLYKQLICTIPIISTIILVERGSILYYNSGIRGYVPRFISARKRKHNC